LKYSDFCHSWDDGKKINFSHEAYIDENGKNKLIKLYQQRIKHFRDELKKNKPILFLQIMKDKEVGEDCRNTYNLLKKICKNKKFAYVVIDCTKLIEPNKIPLEIYLTRITLPENNSDVFSESFYNSEEGKKIEKKIANFIENVIIKEFGLKIIEFS
jgi:hypothetical protein